MWKLRLTTGVAYIDYRQPVESGEAIMNRSMHNLAVSSWVRRGTSDTGRHLHQRVCACAVAHREEVIARRKHS